MENLLFNENDPISIFEFSKKIIGKSIKEFMDENSITNLKGGKGQLGQLVEQYFFHYNPNSNPNADFQKAGVELKCTPLLKKKEGWRIKERLVANMIDYNELATIPFKDSHFYHKCNLMLLLFYCHLYGVNNIDYEFIFRVLWLIPEKDLLILEHDYNILVEKVRNGKAHLISEGDTMYLGACRKGQKGDKAQNQPFSDIKAKKRAFSLKPAYMRTILEIVANSGENYYTNFIHDYKENNQLVSIDELKDNDFEGILTKRFENFYGKNYVEITKSFNRPAKQSKSKYYDSSSLIASKGNTVKANNSEEFIKSGITIKTIRLEQNGYIKESMSFKNIDYEEIYNEGHWENSELYELFTSRFLFVIYRKTKNVISLEDTKGNIIRDDEYILEKAFFWTMPQDDLKKAFYYWAHIRKNVIHNQIFLENFWKISDDNKFHVRPKGTKQSYYLAAINPNGGKVDKYCYWFNNSYVVSIVNSKY